MNNELRSVRLSNHTTVSVTLLNATHESMEKLLQNAKNFSDESFTVETQEKDAYKKVRLIFKEPTAAQSMLQYVTDQMLGPAAS